MADRSSISYLCKSCNSLYFTYSEVMAHKAMTGHYTFEKRGGDEQSENTRQELYRQLEDMGVTAKGLEFLPESALKELVDGVRKAKAMNKDDSKL